MCMKLHSIMHVYAFCIIQCKLQRSTICVRNKLYYKYTIISYGYSCNYKCTFLLLNCVILCYSITLILITLRSTSCNTILSPPLLHVVKT